MKRWRLLALTVGLAVAGCARLFPKDKTPLTTTNGSRDVTQASRSADGTSDRGLLGKASSSRGKSRFQRHHGDRDKGEPEVYTNNEAGYTIAVPPQWRFTSRIVGVDTALVLKKKPDDFPLVTIETIRLPKRPDFHAMLKKVGEELNKRYNKVEFLKDEEVDKNVYRAIYRAETQGQKLLILQIFAKQGEWFAVLSAMDREKEFPRHEKDFQAVFAGIE